MISVEEAKQIIQANTYQPSVHSVKLHDALGLVLAEDITADRDFPPFDRVMMDGIALNTDSLSKNESFQIESTQYAGSPQLELKDPKNCIEVMTGAMLPTGTNAVIPYELIEIKDNTAILKERHIVPYRNVQRKGVEVAEGAVLIEKKTVINTAHIGVLATVGKHEVSVFQHVKTAIVSTGDELVPIDESPKDYQIRMSNNHVLKAALQEFRIDADIYHLNDNRENLNSELRNIFDSHELIILSGGVSKGKKDYVPQVLEDLGVTKLFHRVAQKPAKPFWFGKSKKNTVFALPGNPVSLFLGYYNYVRPWISSSYFKAKNDPVLATLAEDVSFNKDLTYFIPVLLKEENAALIAYPILGKGSGDLANLTKATGFLELPRQSSIFKKGEKYSYIAYNRTF